MKINYSQTGVAQGRMNQAKAQDTPNTFGTESGADQVTQMSKLDKPKQQKNIILGNILWIKENVCFISKSV